MERNAYKIKFVKAILLYLIFILLSSNTFASVGGHDGNMSLACNNRNFLLQTRWQTYHSIDSVPGGSSKVKAAYSYLDNPQYLKRMKLFATEKRKKNIVMLGDSHTERGQWDEILERTDVANRGIGSDITEGYINRLNYVFNLYPKICFIQGGGNDLGHDVPKGTIIRNLAILIDTLQSKGITPVLYALAFVADNYKASDPKALNKRVKTLNRAIRALAKKKKVILIDLNPKITDGKYLLKKYAIADGVHYTAPAYLLWKVEIVKILDRLNLN